MVLKDSSMFNVTKHTIPFIPAFKHIFSKSMTKPLKRNNVVQEPRFNRPSVNNSIVNNSRINTPSVNNSRMNTPIVNNSRMNTPNVNNSRMNNSRMNTPNVNNSRMNNSRMNTPNVNNSRMNNSRMNNSRMNTPNVNNSNRITNKRNNSKSNSRWNLMRERGINQAKRSKNILASTRRVVDDAYNSEGEKAARIVVSNQRLQKHLKKLKEKDVWSQKDIQFIQNIQKMIPNYKKSKNKMN